jgi:hypothetical protein
MVERQDAAELSSVGGKTYGFARKANGEVVAATELGIIGLHSRCRDRHISGQVHGRDGAPVGMDGSARVGRDLEVCKASHGCRGCHAEECRDKEGDLHGDV